MADPLPHGPPLLELLPDAAEQRAATEDIIAAYHRGGVFAALGEFMANAGFPRQESSDDAPAGEPAEQMLADDARYCAHGLRGTTRYVPDTDALKAGPVRIVVGIGAESGSSITYRTSTALVEPLGTVPLTFPGGHSGFVDFPEGFATVPHGALGS